MLAESVSEPAVVCPVFRDNALAHIERQYLQLPVDEQRRLRTILRQVVRLDEQLGELRLLLPAVEIRWYRFDSNFAASILPGELLRAIAVWHASQRRKFAAELHGEADVPINNSKLHTAV